MWALSIYTINLIFVNQIFQTSEGQQNWSEAVSLLLSKFLIFFTYQVNHNYLSQTPKPNYEARINRTGIQSGLCIINNFKSNYSGIKSKCALHIMRPYLEKQIGKFLKIGWVITILVCLTIIQKNFENIFVKLKNAGVLFFCKHPQFHIRKGFWNENWVLIIIF